MIRAENHLSNSLERGGRGVWRIFAALLCLGMFLMSTTASAQTPGDVNGDGVFNVTDVQCSVLIVLAFSPDEMPACAADVQLSDMNCDENTNVVDIQLLVMVILGSMVDDPGLPASQDADLDNVHDACDICPETPNMVQVDADSDGQGDACDAYPDTPGVTGGCAEGATEPAGDGCNSCECTSDHWFCTEMACSSCPAAADYDGNCIQLAVWAQDPSDGSCCAYSTPCAAPAGWETFANPDECEDAGIDPECVPGQVTDDGCNTCECQDDGQWLCTMVYCPTPCEEHADCEEGQICKENGYCGGCSAGELFPADDGCNDCVCTDEGLLACTQAFCPGTCKKSEHCVDELECTEDVCVGCEDPADCEKESEYGVCAHIPKDCDPVCEEGETKVHEDGCNTCDCKDGAWNCTKLFCADCEEGETKEEGCNTCQCLDNKWACTEIECAECGPDIGCSANHVCFDGKCELKPCLSTMECGIGGPGCNIVSEDCYEPAWCGVDDMMASAFGGCDNLCYGTCTGTGAPDPVCEPGTLTDDGCNTCLCTEDGQWQCTLIACPDECSQHADCKEGEICNEDGVCAICEPGTSVPAGDGCNTCICMEEGGLACTKKACPDLCTDDSDCDDGLGCSVDICNIPVCDWNECDEDDESCVNECPSQGFCSHDTENCAPECDPGETQDADDGCNTCTCTEDGQWACTLMYCPEGCENHSDCKEGEICNEEGVCSLCEPGTVVDADDGCNTCICMEGGGLACTKKACPQPCSDSKDCNDGVDCTTDYCAVPDCAPPEFCPEGEDCPFDCPTEGVCMVDHSSCGEVCTPGETQDAEDGCNTCTCTDNGTWNCTKEFCPECEEGDTKDEDCNTCVCINQLWACTKKGCQCSDEANDCDANSTCFKGKCEPNPCLEVSDCAIGGPGCNITDECYVPAWCGENDSMAAEYGGCDDYCYGTCESSGEPGCYDETDPNVEYAGDPQTCMVIYYTCDFEAGWEYFTDECGCGCIKTDTGCADSLEAECNQANGIWMESSCSCKGLDCDGNYVPDIHQFYGDGQCHDGTNDAEPFNLNCAEHNFDCSENGSCDCQSIAECDEGDGYAEGCSLFSCINGQWQEAQISCEPGYVCGEGDCVYDPCYGKACGESCSACDPADKDCLETSVVKSCDPEGQCVPSSDDLCDGGTNACGGFQGLMCADDEYCQYEADTCYWSDNMGECTPIPMNGCPENWDPVCACDGNTYGNLCEMQAALQSLHYEGECASVGECVDGDSYAEGCSTFFCEKGVWEEAIVDCLPGYTCNEGGCDPIACMGDDACPGGLVCDLENYCLSDPNCVDFGPCPDVCFGQCVLPAGDCEANGEYYWAGEEYYEGCSIFQCGNDGNWYQAILDCLPGSVCEDGYCVPEPQVCGDNSECMISVYSDPVWNTDSCYCPMCPGTVLTQDEHNQRQADWLTHCAEWEEKNPCPVPGCAYPGTAYCEFEPGVCNLEGGTGLCTMQPEIDQCFEPFEDETVCGCDGSTYPSACVASTTGASVDYSGSCQAQPSACCMGDIAETMCTHMTAEQCTAEGAVFVEGSECGEVDCASILAGETDPCLDKECGDVCATSNGMLDVMMYCQPDGSCGMNAAPECEDDTSSGSVGDQCGGIAGWSCNPGLFCEKPEGTCDFIDMAGFCTEATEFCPEVYNPVCGCDGGTYSNDCYRRAAMVSLKHLGACGSGGGGGGEELPDMPDK